MRLQLMPKARILDMARKFASDQSLPNFYDMQGICHVVLPEQGSPETGNVRRHRDSHSPTGAFGCFMFGIGATDMAGVWQPVRPGPGARNDPD